MASFPTVDFSQYQWVVNDTNYLTKWNNFQTAINTLQANINKFGAEAKAESDSAIGIARSLIEAYKVNVLEPFKAKCTLGLDFAQGRYFVDDGLERVETTDPESFLTIDRNTAHNSWAPDKILTESSIDSIARAYDLCSGEPLGYEVSREKTNEFLWSTDLANTVWQAPSVGNLTITESSYAAPTNRNGTDKFFKLEVNAGGSYQGKFDQTQAVSAGERVSVSALIHKDFNRLGFVVFRVAGDRAAFDMTTGELATNPLPDGIHKTYDLGDCYLISVSHVASAAGSVVDGIWFNPTNSVGVVTDFQVGDYAHLAAPQWERGTPSNYIPTGSSDVVRASDATYIDFGGEFNPGELTIYWEGFLNIDSENNGSAVFSVFKAGSSETLIIVQRSTTTPSRARLLSTIFGNTSYKTFPLNDRIFKIAVSASKKNNLLVFSINGESIEKQLDGTLDTSGDYRFQFSRSGYFSQPVQESIVSKTLVSAGYSTAAELNALTAGAQS